MDERTELKPVEAMKLRDEDYGLLDELAKRLLFPSIIKEEDAEEEDSAIDDGESKHNDSKKKSKKKKKKKTKKQPALMSNRTFRGKEYANVCVGSEIVDFFVGPVGRMCKSRLKAVVLGQRLVDAGVLRHVADAHGFEDAKLFYRIVVTDPTVPKPTMTQFLISGYLSTDEGAVLGKHRVCPSFLVYSGRTVYVFRTQLCAAPNRVFPLQKTRVVLNSVLDSRVGSDRRFWCIHLFGPNGRELTLAFAQPRTRYAWIGAFVSSGQVVTMSGQM
jgi:hypothetical protein